MRKHSKYSVYFVTCLTPVIILFLSVQGLVDGVRLDGSIYLAYISFAFGTLCGLVPSLTKVQINIDSTPSQSFKILLNLTFFVALISAVGAILHIKNNGINLNVRDELEFDGAGLLFPMHAELRSIGIVSSAILTIGATLYLRKIKYILMCAACILLFSVSLASRAVAVTIFFMPLALFLSGWFKINLKITLGFSMVVLMLILLTSIIQDRSDSGNAFVLLYESIFQALGYYLYPPYLFSELLKNKTDIDVGFALFGSPIVIIYNLFDLNYSDLVNDFFTRKFDLIDFTGNYTPANVFHAWPSLLYVTGGILACAAGGLINGLIISFCRIFGGPISYAYAIYYFAFGSYIFFPLQRMSTILGLVLCIYLDKSIVKKMSRRL